MIICPNRGIVFVHIPKCAGTSVRSQVLLCDSEAIELGRVGDHPRLGRIDFGHIPLDQLRVHFPDYYANVRDMASFAVLRDPLERFGSALRQVLWQYEKRPMTLIAPDELRDLTLRMLERIQPEIEAPSHPYIFFMRQERFVFDEGRQITRHLVPLDLVAEFIAHLSRRTGVPMETDARANQNVDLKVKGPLGAAAFRVNGILRSVLPRSVHTRIKDAALGVLSTRQSAADASGVLNLPEVRSFVARHYGGDLALFAAVRARKDDIAAGLIADDPLDLGFASPPAS